MLGASGTIRGYNLFSYCESNPVNYFDDTGCLLQAIRDKAVHDMVLSRICGNNPALSMTQTCVYYNGMNWLGGFGYCDLYNVETGEVWELKKKSNSFSCTTAAAQIQLSKYTSGKLKHHPELDLVLPYKTIITSGTFDFTDGNYEYHVNYWYESYGVLRYSYTYKATQNGQLLDFAYAAIIAASMALYNYKAAEYGLPSIR